jgi:multidrug efflux pump subunit AcrA (membrane-fusion protein)
VRVLLDDACPAMPAGRYVEIAIPTASAQDAGAPTLLVPATALTDVRGTPTVFVASGAEGTFVARGVRVGATLGADVEIASGLTAGERVAIEGVILLKGELLKAELQ